LNTAEHKQSDAPGDDHPQRPRADVSGYHVDRLSSAERTEAKIGDVVAVAQGPIGLCIFAPARLDTREGVLKAAISP
jgi:hypothetical protein